MRSRRQRKSAMERTEEREKERSARNSGIETDNAAVGRPGERMTQLCEARVRGNSSKNGPLSQDLELHTAPSNKYDSRLTRGHPYMTSALRGEGGLDQKKM